MNDTILYEVADGVGTLTLNRPASLNALSVDMMEALRRTVERAAADQACAVLVIRGAGEHFMAGGDVKVFREHLELSPDTRLATFRAMIEQWINPTVECLRRMHQPVLCAVQGACAGLGFSLMSGCDLVVAADNAYFNTAYASIALSPDGGGTWFLPRIVGRRKALELMLLPQKIAADEALRLGLVNRVVPAAELEAESAALARRLAHGPRHAHAEIKRLLHDSASATLTAQLTAEAVAFARCSATEDFAEGVQAFVEKRAPKFGG